MGLTTRRRNLIGELRTIREIRSSDLKQRIFSEEPLSYCVYDCLRLSGKYKNEEIEKWLMNELYGYKLSEEFSRKNEGRKIEEVVNELPNHPQYRILKVKLKFLYGRKYEEIDYPIFWTKPITELEYTHNDLHMDGANKIYIVKLPLGMFPTAAVPTLKKMLPGLNNILLSG